MPPATADNRIAQLIRAVFSMAVVLVVLLIYPYTPRPTEDIKWLVVSWAGLVTGALWLSSPFFTRDPMRWPRLFGPIIVALLGFFAAASLMSPHSGLNLYETRKFVSLALAFGAAAYAYRTSTQVRTLMLAMCFAVSLSSVYAYFQRAGVDPFPWNPAQLDSDEYRNLPGSFGNPNYAAHAMVLTIILSIYLAFGAGWRWCAVFLPVFAIHLMATQQRAGLIALAVAAVLVLFARNTHRLTAAPARRAALAMAATGVIVIAAAAAVMGYLAATTGSPYPLDQSLLIRYQAYVSATEMIIDRPVLGYGPGSYPLENPPYWTQYEQQFFARELQLNEHVHCDPLELAVDAGVPAASLYLILLSLAVAYGLFWSFTRRQRDEAAMGLAFAAAFTAFAVDGLFGFNLRVPVTALFLFLLLGALEGLWRQVHATATANEPLVAPPWWKPAGAVLIAAALVSTAFDTRHFAAMRDLQAGRAWASVGEFSLAHERLDRAAARVPWYWRIPHERAASSRRQGDIFTAAEYMSSAAALHPHSVFVLTEAARTHLSLVQQLVEAIGTPSEERTAGLEAALQTPLHYAERATSLCPYYAEAHELLGRAHSTRASDLEHHASSLDDAARAHLTSTWQRAAKHLELALHHGARNRDDLYNALAVARIGERNDDGAHEALTRAIAAAPAGPHNWGLYLRFARYTGRYDAMADSLNAYIDDMLEEDGNHAARIAEACHFLGAVYLEGLDDADAAEEAFRRAVRLHPRDGGAWRTYADFAARHGDLATLQEFVREIWRTRDELPEGLPPHIIALALAWDDEAESFARGAAVMSRFLLDQPGEQVATGIRQDMSWAADLLMAAAQGLPATGEAAARARLHTGIIQIRLGRHAAGLGLLRAALPELPRTARIDCRVHMANALIQLDRLDEAARELERVVELEPSLIDLWVLLARTHRDAGQTFEARRTYDSILREFDLDRGSRAILEEELRALGS